MRFRTTDRHTTGWDGPAAGQREWLSPGRPEERRRLGYLRNHARGELKDRFRPSEVLDIKRNRLMSAQPETRPIQPDFSSRGCEGADSAFPSASSVCPCSGFRSCRIPQRGRDRRGSCRSTLAAVRDALSPTAILKSRPCGIPATTGRMCLPVSDAATA